MVRVTWTAVFSWLLLAFGGLSPVASQDLPSGDSVRDPGSVAALLKQNLNQTERAELHSRDWQILALERANLLLLTGQLEKVMAVADSVRDVASDSLRYEASDYYFHGLNLSERLPEALRLARTQVAKARTCWQRTRWQADLALVHERRSAHDSAQYHARLVRSSPCASKLGDHRYLATISEARAYRAQGISDSAQAGAITAMRMAPDVGTFVESSLLLFESAPCDDSWSIWQSWGDSLRRIVSEHGTELDHFRFATAETMVLGRLSDCSSSFEANPDTLVQRAKQYLRLGRRLNQTPLGMVTIQTGFSTVLMNMDRFDHALKVADLPLEVATYDSPRDSLRTRFFSLLTPTSLRVLNARYETALDDTGELREVARQLEDPTLEIVADIYRGIVLLHSQQPQRALTVLRSAESTLSELSEESFLSTISARGLAAALEPNRLLRLLYIHLGGALGFQDQRRAAEQRFKQALKYAHTAEDSSVILSSMAVGRVAQFDSTAADSLRKRAYQLGRGLSDPVGLTSLVHSVVDQLGSSDSLANHQGWALSDSLLATNGFREYPLVAAQLRSSRSKYLFRRFQTTGKEILRQRALDEALAAIDLLDEEHSDSRLWITVHLDAARAAKDFSVSSRYARTAVQAATQMKSVLWLMVGARLLANSEVARGNYLAADSALDKAILAAEEMRFRSTRDRRVRRRLGGVDVIEGIYRDATVLSVARRRPWKAFLIAEMSKARGLSDMLLEASVSDSSDLPRRSQEASVTSETVAAEDDSVADNQFLREVRQARGRAEKAADLDSIYVKAFRRSMRATFGRDSLRARLKRLDTGVLSYFRAGPFLLTWVMAGDSIWVHSDSLDAGSIAQLTEQIAASASAATGRQSRAAVRARERTATVDLYDRLVAPVEYLLSRVNAENLIVIPHGVLYRVPFSALGPEEGPVLADRYRTSVLPALHLLGLSLKSFRSNTGDSQLKYLGVGDASGSLLRSTGELQDAAKHFGRATVLADSLATEGEVRQRWKAADVLHFAAHAVADDSVINDGYVRLAPSDETDGHLTVEEVLKARPLSARVVVLSACQTGRGALLDGEGVMGFGRAFLASGAEAVIVTLWPMDDRVAHYFTSRFYRAWRSNGMAVPEAFAAAQQATRNRFLAVHDWAGFVLLARDW